MIDKESDNQAMNRLNRFAEHETNLNSSLIAFNEGKDIIADMMSDNRFVQDRSYRIPTHQTFAYLR